MLDICGIYFSVFVTTSMYMLISMCRGWHGRIKLPRNTCLSGVKF